MKLSSIYIPFFIGLAVSLGIFIGGKLNFTDNTNTLFTSNSKKDKLNRLIDYIDYEYVDEVNTDSIVDVTVNGILDNLDPHSVYIPKKDLERVSENMKGDFVGIGISFYTYKDTIAIIKTIENGPSQQAGLIGGDRIIIANGDSLSGKKFKNGEIVKKLKGPIDTDVVLEVIRHNEPSPLKFSIKRARIPIKSVVSSYMVNDSLGYIKINRFAEITYKEFKEELDKLQLEGATALALDLRENPGGFLAIAEKIVDEFLENDKLILFTKNKHGKIDKSFASDEGDFETGDVYVLIDENSASASEIVAGALQDNDKGTIVGRRSYGKGLVQREMQLGDGSAVRLTVSRYYTPTGRSIQRSYKKGEEDYFDDYYSRIENGELTDESKIIVDDSLKFITPKGKVVYGGGGIIPDVFVPIDRGMENETIKFLARSGFMNYFVFEQLDKDRNAYKDFSRDEFVNDFELADEVIEDFQDYVKQKTGRDIVFVAYNKEVKLYLKATLAEQLYDTSVYQEIVNQNDAMIQKVLELSKGKQNNDNTNEDNELIIEKEEN